MASANDDCLYAVVFTLSGEIDPEGRPGVTAPGDHVMAFRSSPNRVTATKHMRQIVDAHNATQPDNEMAIKTMTKCTPQELDALVAHIRETGGPERVDATELFPEEKDMQRLIAPRAMPR